MQILENNDNVLPEVETVFELHNAIVAFVVCAIILIHIVKLRQELNCDVGVSYVKFLVFAYFGRYDSLVRVSTIGAADDLAEGALSLIHI